MPILGIGMDGMPILGSGRMGCRFWALGGKWGWSVPIWALWKGKVGGHKKKEEILHSILAKMRREGKPEQILHLILATGVENEATWAMLLFSVSSQF